MKVTKTKEGYRVQTVIEGKTYTGSYREKDGATSKKEAERLFYSRLKGGMFKTPSEILKGVCNACKNSFNS